MKRLFVVLALFCSQAFAAKTFDFQFNEIRFPVLLQLVYSEVLDRSYVLDTPALKNDDLLSLHIKNKTADEVEAYILALLDSKGFAISRRGAVDVIGDKPKKEDTEPEKEVFVYRPRFRSVVYLTELLTGLFPNGSFATQRNISSPITQNSIAAGTIDAKSSLNTTQAMPQNAVRDTGTSAYSQIDKNTRDVLIFNGEQKHVKKLVSLLSQLDQATPELLVKAVVYEVRTEKSTGSAVTLAASILSGKFGIAIDGGASTSNAVKLKFSSIDAVYSALSGDKRFKLVSSPTVRVLSGATAKFTAGSEVPIIASTTYSSTGSSVQNVEYKPSGVILDLKPLVREETTDLTLTQQISSFVATTTGVNNSPTLLKRELTTQVSAKSDEMIVLGGLEENQSTVNEQGLSFLPAFMRANTDDRIKTEIMVVMNVQRI